MNKPTQLALRPGIFADASGALYLESSQALLVADVHLGYAWAQRRRGELGPLTDGGVADRLRAVVCRWNPRQLVLLGDLVHLGKPSDEERRFVEAILSELAGYTTVTVVLGNHDRHFERDFGQLGLPCTRLWGDDQVIAVHGDGAWPDSTKWLVMGHLHPAIGLEDSVGVTRRLPVFVAGIRALILPAFSPFAAGFDLRKELSPDWRLLFGEDPVRLAATTGTQVRLLPKPFVLRYRPPEAKK